MDPLALTLISLCSTSLMLAVAFAIAWRRFGRDPHVVLWSAAFLAATAGHGAQLVKPLFPVPLMATIASAICLIASFALLATGFRRRAGLRSGRWWVILGGAVGAAMVAALLLHAPESNWYRAIINAASAVLLAISADAVHRAPMAGRAKGSATILFLCLASAYSAALAVVALAISTHGPITADLYRVAFLIGVPSGSMGVGLAALMLLGADMAERLRRLAEVDPLTGVLNRRGIEQAALPLIALARRSAWPVAIVVADLDRFKAINDRFGHPLGDIVLRRFAAHAAATLRGGDLIGRLGGEEFVFVLAKSDPARAAEAMERLRAGLAGITIDLDPEIRLTASFGIAALGDRSDGFADAVGRADDALYQSKNTGRDRITIAPTPPRGAGDPRFRLAWSRQADSDDRLEPAQEA